MTQFSDSILNWYDQHGRKHLPWQQNINPYRIWVSEIMLQQTQVTTVIPYYERFMAKFPSVAELANATQDEVLHLWTGLGYYARGRNLHACAQRLVKEYEGQFPRSVEALSDLPGIGRSTAGAIASISMGIRAPILDGNVKRVLARYYAVEGWPGTTSVQKELWQIAERHTPSERAREYTQAMMDMGATLCTRSKPACGICPLQPGCQGYATGWPTQFPNSKPKKAKSVKSTWMLIVQNTEHEFFLQQRPATGIWGGLWSFPEFNNQSDAESWLALKGLKYQSPPEELTPFRHTFSHYHLDIHPVRVSLSQPTRMISEQGSHWYSLTKEENIGLSAPVKKLLETLSRSEQDRCID